MKEKEYLFSLDMKVRDYECDLQGVVNNSNYQRYMEHTRHEFWESLGDNFGQMHEKGLDASGDCFRSCLTCHKKGPKLIFMQDIIREDGVMAACGEVEVVAVQDGVLTRGEYFDVLMKDILSKTTK